MPGFADFILAVVALLALSFVCGLGLALAWRCANRER